MSMSKPYLSFIIAGRNDGYGGDLEARFAAFLRHLHYRLGDGAELFEIVVCDWNPPQPERTMESGFDWSAFAHVRFITAPSAVHTEYVGQSEFPILDYIARNVAVRNSRGHFACIFNQDIYLSEAVADMLVRRVLDERYFYRADRCDFDDDFAATPQQQDQRMLAHCFAVNRRHGGFDDAITSPVAANSTLADWPTSSARAYERIAEGGRLAYAPPERPIDSPATKTISLASVLRRSCLHTNAAGDFIIAVGVTVDDTLYQSGRSDQTDTVDMSYRVKAPNGGYTVKLHFAEMRFTAVGQRVFNVAIEGVPVLQSFDILSEATRDAALVKTFNVIVTDGVVDIDFTRGGADGPIINGIEVVLN